MRILRKLPHLLMLGTAISGCSQPLGLRKDQAGVKTIASVGDRPLPVRTGPLDSSVRSGVPEPIVASSGGRVSGRVFDDQGKPVPDARVRLAVGSERGGKAVTATTDRSGAFTLRGLRAGSSYTVIADSEGSSGSLSGRADVEAPEANVRISLKPIASPRDDTRTSVRPARPNVEPASNVEPADEDEESDANSRFNREDIDPPALEADRMDESETPRTSRSSTTGPASRQGRSWTQGGKGTARRIPAEEDGSEGSPTGKRDRAVSDPDGTGEEDENPLPPAIGSDTVGSASDERHSDDSVRMAQARVGRTSSDHGADADRQQPAKFEIAEPQPLPDGFMAGARAVSSQSYGPIQMGDSPEPPTRPVSGHSRGGANVSAAVPARKPRTPTSAPVRPTWGELSFLRPSIPLDESLQKTSRGKAPVTPAATTRPEAVGKPPEPTPNPATRLVSRSEPACNFDPGERRLHDFLLPDVQGRMVSFRDFDADLILLDFWGTWCTPCQKSIGHLVELQKQLGGKRIQVIGIACEKSQAAARSANVAQAIKRHGINYPVLISSMENPCPVQEAFQVQFYPTLVLLDREGRIIRREEGATNDTLGRLDRFIARSLNLARPESDEAPAQVARSAR